MYLTLESCGMHLLKNLEKIKGSHKIQITNLHNYMFRSEGYI